jgi:cysteine synthase A
MQTIERSTEQQTAGTPRDGKTAIWPEEPESALALHRLKLMTGPTPTIHLERVNGCDIWVKLEYEHPSGSTKDRVAAAVLTHAATTGAVNGRTVVVEASSGSTSVSFAMACSLLEIPFVAVMPENVSAERSLMIRRLGGSVVLTAAADGMAGALAAVAAMAADDPNVFLPMQFENPRNTATHATTTAQELARQIPTTIDGFVAGVGTGGTLTGIARGLRARNRAVVIADAQPKTADGRPSSAIPGVVHGYSRLLGAEPPDRAVPVGDATALAEARELGRRGLPVGPSSGLNVAAARILAAQSRPGSCIATILPDRMERYFSSELFADLSAGDGRY